MSRSRKTGLVVVFICVIAAFLVVLKRVPKENSVNKKASLVESFKKSKWDSFDKKAPETETGGKIDVIDDGNTAGNTVVHNSKNGSAADKNEELSSNNQKPQKSPAELEEENCWKKIDNDIVVQDFYEYNRKDLDKKIGGWYIIGEKIDDNYKPEGIADKFYLALGYADLLKGRQIKTDLSKSIELFDEVIEADPSNSAPLLFAAIAAQKMGKPPKARGYISRAEDTTYFNSYFSQISRDVHSRVRSSADYIQAIGLSAQTPIADYIALMKLLKEIGSTQYPLQLIEKGMNDETAVNDMDWFVIEYAIGYKLLSQLDPTKKIPTYQEVIKLKRSKHILNTDSLLKDMRATCRLNAVDPYVKILQEHLNKN